MAYSTINKSTDYFTPFTFTGTGSAGTRTGVGFTPDMFIHKNRDSNQGWGVIDVIRGNGNYLGTNTTNAQLSDVGNYGIATDGYTFPNGDTFFNGSGNNMAYWNWKAGGAGSSNTDGSITSTVSANTTAGFSIVKYTGASNASGATIGHGLGAVPKMIIVKETSSSGNNWVTYNSNLGAGKYMALNLTIADQSSSIMWHNTTPTNSVFSVANDSQTNGSGSTFIAYCFAEKTGYSKFGSYVGNVNADGTFVYTGFKPAFVIIKRYDAGTNDWVLYDSKRNINGIENALEPNNNNSESTVIAKTDYNIDLLSNGFKPRNNSDQINNGSYIYMCFAEAPLVGSNNVPCTAR